MNYRGLVLSIASAILVIPMLSCGGGHSGETYILVSANIKVPYWQSAGAGFAQAAQQLGVAYAFTGPDTYDPNGERDAFESAVQKRPAGILISVADANLLKDNIDRAIASHI